MPWHHVPENIEVMESSSDTGSDSDEELLKIFVRQVLSHSLTRALQTKLIIQMLEIAQKLLLNMQGRQRELLKQNALLEASAAKGQKKLTCDKLELAVKEEAIRLLGRKYSITHCLWINPQIFPLHTHPNIDLNTELFSFVPETDHEMMNHKHFCSHFAKGVGNVRSEMVSDIKPCAGAIFGLNPEFFLRGYDPATQEECCILICSPHGSYTKFAPILFPNPDSLLPNNFLKSAVLVKILKVSICGKTSLSSNVQSSKMKAKIWELQSTTPGMIAAAATVGAMPLPLPLSSTLFLDSSLAAPASNLSPTLSPTSVFNPSSTLPGTSMFNPSSTFLTASTFNLSSTLPATFMSNLSSTLPAASVFNLSSALPAASVFNLSSALPAASVFNLSSTIPAISVLDMSSTLDSFAAWYILAGNHLVDCCLRSCETQ
ncbi:hypothetical protein CY34DRAFT_9495 [Suillus luteus UH-Slu-Lm8-n1]|uniref:Uncharacterized protein n=1 Tax=Suillus luteus UH-Slu-Lm8-n1 TaxID=930992 RepID=A0A0D0A8Z4_9AGAM|nr:hypothetical protein CY34DRAFT_9495 [Suillus luteus UH-Slu-Lm8-n1]